MSEGHHMDPLVNILGPLDGARLPGGCDHCDAYQTVRAASPRVWLTTVFHDDDCPVLRKVEERCKEPEK